ncbi:helix-turn-helix transcriptional regulator [Flavobacteriales bacterium 34_180_T64]|nr:helix-turn-helix transcriptional regulator [Flavobacteriales bacterium 34_180_T64]
MKKTILIFSSLIIALLLFFQLSKYALISGNMKIEITIAIIAILFFFVGIYINKKSLRKPLNPNYSIDQKKIQELEITTREYEVLEGIASGFSNKEIAEKLFLSESTIKTYVSNLLVKLNAKRRTQALQIAKSLQII